MLDLLYSIWVSVLQMNKLVNHFHQFKGAISRETDSNENTKMCHEK